MSQKHIPPFSDWLKTQWYRLDNVGSLAEIVQNDGGWPKGKDFTEVKRYLQRAKLNQQFTACLFAALQASFCEYERLAEASRNALVESYSLLGFCVKEGIQLKVERVKGGGLRLLGVKGGIVARSQSAFSRIMSDGLKTRIMRRADIIVHILDKQDAVLTT